MNAVQVGVLLEQLLKGWTANALGQTGRDDDRAALLDDRQRAGHALDRLVEGGVERVTGAAGDHDIDRFWHRVRDDVAHEFDALQKRLLP